MIKNSLFFAYIVALLATCASLYISEVLGHEACKLCWSQRVFLFPLPILLFFIILFKRKDIAGFLLPLPILGAFASGWHIYMILSHCNPCSNISYFPFCSLAVFLWVIIFLSISLTTHRTIK